MSCFLMTISRHTMSTSFNQALFCLSAEIDAPKNLKAIDVQTETSTITWKAPQANIDGYILTYRAEDGSMQVCSTHKHVQLHTVSISV